MIAELVEPGHVDAFWPLIAADIIKCLNKTPSYLSAGELWQMCRSGQAFLIVTHEDDKLTGAAIWQFQHGYNRHVFDCLMLVGRNSRAWTEALFDKAAEIARNGGATALTATGRIGLGKAIKHIPGVRVTRQSYMVEM